MPWDEQDACVGFEMLSDFADDELAPVDAALVQTHLESCAKCAEFVSFVRALSSAMRSLPTRKPPDACLEDLLRRGRGRSGPREMVLQLDPEMVGASGRSHIRRPFVAFMVAAICVAAFLLTSVDRVMGGTNLLTLRSANGGVRLEYQTISELAAETSLRARIRYWVPDSLRFAQTEPGFTTAELARTDPALFEGFAELPEGIVYAAAVVEDVRGDRLDTNLGRFWEQLERDRQGRPTARARLYQMRAMDWMDEPRRIDVVRRGVAEFPERPELWVALLVWRQLTVEGLEETDLKTHRHRLERLDAAARRGGPTPSEMYALSVYARLLGRPEIERYWASELASRYPRHEYAAQANLGQVMRSAVSDREKLASIDRSWTQTPVASVANVGLALSYGFEDPALTRLWLDRYASVSVLRDLRLDVAMAERMADVPALRGVAEDWILERLRESRDWVGPARPLTRSRAGFETEVAESQARLHLLLGRLRLVRRDSAGALAAMERAVERIWNSEALVELANLHQRVGSPIRAATLRARAQADPLTSPRALASMGASADSEVTPTDADLATARRAWRERLTSSLLDERINRAARLRSPSGEETTLRALTEEGTTLVAYFQPNWVSQQDVDLIEANAEDLAAAGVRTHFVALDSGPTRQAETAHGEPLPRDASLLYDKHFEVWRALGCWRGVQYFVLGSRGMLRYRGEDQATALRIALVLDGPSDPSDSSNPQQRGRES